MEQTCHRCRSVSALRGKAEVRRHPYFRGCLQRKLDVGLRSDAGAAACGRLGAGLATPTAPMPPANWTKFRRAMPAPFTIQQCDRCCAGGRLDVALVVPPTAMKAYWSPRATPHSIPRTEYGQRLKYTTTAAIS